MSLTPSTRPRGSRTRAALLAVAALVGGLVGVLPARAAAQQRPVTQRPVTQRPVTQRPVTQRPVTQRQRAQRPLATGRPAPAAQVGGRTSPLVGGGVGGGGTVASFAPWPIRTASGTLAWISRVATPVETSPLLFPGRFALVLSVFVESTQTEEFFALQVPSTPPSVRQPLLTGFHGFNTSYQDIVSFTTFFDEAAQRDWFIVTPFQVSTVGNPQISFASVQSQEHVEAVLAYLLQNYWIDRDRLYAVGFSMGGGNALSYAARHRDRSTGAFAAVVNHTGTVALSDVYVNEPLARAQMDLLFGGTPTQSPFEYQRSSLIELDAAGQYLPGGRHMGRNLVDVPIRNYYGIGDPQQYLLDQTIAFDAYMQTLPGSQSQLFGVPVNPACAHCWETIDETEVCDWLALQALNPSSTSGAFLVDRSTRWGPLDVETHTASSFGELTYDIDVLANTISVFETSNTDVVSVDIAEIGLDPLIPIRVRMGAADGTGDRIIIHGIPSLPGLVVRNAVSIQQDPGCAVAPAVPTWCYDANLQTLEIKETGSTFVNWAVVP